MEIFGILYYGWRGVGLKQRLIDFSRAMEITQKNGDEVENIIGYHFIYFVESDCFQGYSRGTFA